MNIEKLLFWSEKKKEKEREFFFLEKKKSFFFFFFLMLKKNHLFSSSSSSSSPPPPLLLLLPYLLRRPRVQHVDGESPPRDLKHRSVPEERREARRVERRRGDDQAKVPGPARGDGLEHAEQHVCVEGALVGLVHDDGRVGLEVRVAEGLAEEDAWIFFCVLCVERGFLGQKE